MKHYQKELTIQFGIIIFRPALVNYNYLDNLEVLIVIVAETEIPGLHE